MSLDLKFAFVCRRQFGELSGDSELVRFCTDCGRHVHNLDPLDDLARLELFEEAKRIGARPCVAATLPLAGSAP